MLDQIVSDSDVKNPAPWPGPTPQMLDNDPLFEAIWSAIKSWDINVPSVYGGYCGATGNHARAIYDAIRYTRCDECGAEWAKTCDGEIHQHTCSRVRRD